MSVAGRQMKAKQPIKGLPSNVEIGIPGFNPTYKSLYLDTLSRQDLAGNPSQKHRLPKKNASESAASPSLMTVDIDLAYPQRLHKNLNFGEYTQETLPKTFKDEPGMRPRQRIPHDRNRPHYGLMVDDIPGCQPKYRERKTRARNTDPLQPRYQISKVTNDHMDTVITHPSLYSSLDVSDIDGAQPKKRDASAPRSTRLDVHDIEGAAPGWQPAHRLMFKRDNDPFVNKFTRRQYRKINDVSDIPGAQPIHPHEEYQKQHKQKLAESSERHKAHVQAYQVMEEISLNRDTLERTWTSLKMSDKDRAGLIEGGTFRKVLLDSGADISPQQADVLVAGLVDNAGFLNYRMFAKTMLKKLPADSDAPPPPGSRPPKSSSRGRQPWCSDTRVQSPSPSRPSSARSTAPSFSSTPRQRPSSAPPTRAPRSRSVTPRATTPTRSSTPGTGRATSSNTGGFPWERTQGVDSPNSPTPRPPSPADKQSSPPASKAQPSSPQGPSTSPHADKAANTADHPASPAAAQRSPSPGTRQRSPSPSRSPVVGAAGSSPFTQHRSPRSQPQSPTAPKHGPEQHQQPTAPLKTAQVSPQVSGSLPQSPATASTYHDAAEEVSSAGQPSPPTSPAAPRSPTKTVTIVEPSSPTHQPKSPDASKPHPDSAPADASGSQNVTTTSTAQGSDLQNVPTPFSMPPTQPHPTHGPNHVIPTNSTSSDVSSYVDQPRRQVWIVESPSSATSSAAVTVAAGIARGVDSPVNDGDLVPALNVRTLPAAVDRDPVVQEEWWPDAVAAPLGIVQDEEPPTPSQGGHTTECEDEPSSSMRLSPLPARRVLEELDGSESQPDTARQQPQSPMRADASVKQKMRQALAEELADQAKSLEYIRASLQKAEMMQANLVKPTTRKEDGEALLRLVSGKDEREQRDQLGWTRSSAAHETSSWGAYTSSAAAAAGDDSPAFWQAARSSAPAGPSGNAHAAEASRQLTLQRQPSTTASADMMPAGAPSMRPVQMKGDQPMGFGSGGWPPEPVPYRPQRRTQAAILDSSRASDQTTGNVRRPSNALATPAPAPARKKRTGIRARLAALGRGLRALVPTCNARTVDDASECD